MTSFFSKFYNMKYSDDSYAGGFEKKDNGLLRFRKIEDLLGRYKILSLCSVLDIGCSTGEFLAYLNSDDELKYGVDVSSIAVKKARVKGIKAKCIDVNSGKLPFKDESFDVVCVSEVLEHLVSADNLVKEVKRVMKNNGIAYFSVPNGFLKLDFRLALLFGKLPNEYRGLWDVFDLQHLRFFSKKSFRIFLRKNGFKTVFFGGLPLSAGCFELPFGGFLANAFTDLLSTHYVAVVKK